MIRLFLLYIYKLENLLNFSVFDNIFLLTNIYILEAVATIILLYDYSTQTFVKCFDKNQDLSYTAAYCFEQIFEAAPYRAAVAWPFISHPTKHPFSH